MPTFDATSADCVVYVYTEGVASAMGHDLAIEATDFSVEVDEDDGSIEAEFAADSLQVRHAMDDGEPQPGKPPAKDKKKIARNIRKDVLETKRFPVITFRSTAVAARDGVLDVEGVLGLHGVEQTISFEARAVDGATRACVSINQPDFDITPYKALLGALKIEPKVDVKIELPYEVAPAP
ncbi:MAG: YceI family protein [Persicimonas sp.]